MNKSEFLAELRAERARWDDLLARVPEDWMREPGVDGPWSLQDIIAHIAWFEREMVQLLEGHTLRTASSLWELPQDARNAAVFAQNRDRDLDAVLEEAEGLYPQMLALIERLAEEDLHDPARFAGMPADWRPWQILMQNSYEHYAAHAPAVRAWLESHPGPMLPPVRNKPEILAALAEQRAHWRGVLSRLDESRMEQPGVMGTWTFKDLVAHLTGWRKQTVARLEAAARGGEPQPPEWPGDPDDFQPANDWIYAHNRDRPLQEVLAESEQVFNRLQAAVEALSEEDLMRPGRFAWLAGKPLVATILGSLDHYYGEHGLSLRALQGDA